MKFLGVQSYEKRVVSHCFFDFYLEKRKKNLTFAPEIVKRQAQMLESVDKSVSNTDAERRAGSTPALGTRLKKQSSVNQVFAEDFYFSRCTKSVLYNIEVYFWGVFSLIKKGVQVYHYTTPQPK